MPWFIDMILNKCYFIEEQYEIIDLTEKRRSTIKRKKPDFFNYNERVL